jgi:hypothetical protein
MRNKILIGITTVVAAAAIAGPAQAQEVIPPAQPSTPTGIPTPTPTPTPTPAPDVPPAQPSLPGNPTVSMGNCTVAKSRHGYVYAVCQVNAGFLNAGQSATVSYKSNLKVIRPRTVASWRNQAGHFTLTNTGDSMANLTGTMKFAFKNRSEAHVRRDLKIMIAAVTPGISITSPIGVA